ncbi:unnamed protein product [Brassica oleracea var. botrytis]|uniref:Uncharacterized protein n=1 Tax=Brassica carinata TaxID=52824 RepID=A0A8X7Q6J5_BRACI|nr:hypothetical protein Bca52824_071564 [Brassica carinata]
MGEGAYSKPTSLGRYIVFYAILLYYVAFCSVSTIHFVFPFTLRVMHIGWLIFVDKRWNVLAILLCLAAFVRYIFSKSNKEYSTEAEDLLSQYMAFEQPSYTPLSPPSSLLSPPSSPPLSPPSSLLSPPSSPPLSPPSSLLSPPSSPPLSPPSSLLSPPSSPPSSFTYPRSSLSPSWSSLQSSPRSSFSFSSPPRPPPPPPFKMRPCESKYVRMGSNASLSSEESSDSDIDSKAEKFIAQFRSRLKFEKERLHECANKSCDPNN